jgi:flagellar motor switch protein FliM
MAEELSDGQLAALLAARKQTQLAHRAPVQAEPQSYDFRRPQLLSQTHTQLVGTLHEQFCRDVSARLANSMRQVVDTRLAFSDQSRFSDFVLALPSPCMAYTFGLAPSGQPVILSLAPDLVAALIDRSLGGIGLSATKYERDLTPLERKLINKTARPLLQALSNLWNTLGPATELSDISLATNPESIQAAAPTAGVIVVGLEVSLPRTTGLLQVCYPLSTLEPLLPNASRSPRQRPSKSGDARQRSLKQVEIPLTVQLASGTLALKDVAALAPQDVIRLETQRDEPAVVFIGGRPKFLARPGLDGQRRALRILAVVPPDQENEYT